MTSFILAQKLSKVNLDITEFQKLRDQRAEIRKETRRVVKALKPILDQQIDNKTCRLCLKPGDKEIFNSAKDLDVALNIRCIIGIEITEGDGKPQHICKPCETTLRRASKLKQVAETSQWILEQEQEMVNGVSISAEGGAKGDSIDHDHNKAPESAHTDITPLFTVAESLDWNEGANEEVSTEDLLFWRCFKCKKKFQSLEEFRKHDQGSPCDEKRGFECETCGKVMKTRQGLNRHSSIHTGERSYACASCPYRCRLKGQLVVHERVHTGLRPARCAQCGAAFRTTAALAGHRLTHAPPQYCCQYCQRGFRFRRNLNKHIASKHNASRAHHCDICGRDFKTRNTLLWHELYVHKRPKMHGKPRPARGRSLTQNDADN